MKTVKYQVIGAKRFKEKGNNLYTAIRLDEMDTAKVKAEGYKCGTFWSRKSYAIDDEVDVCELKDGLLVIE